MVLEKIKNWVLSGIGFVFILWVVHAAVTLTATDGESLTAAKWNALVDKVEGINTDVWGNAIASEPTANNHVATKNYVDTQLSSAGGGFTDYVNPKRSGLSLWWNNPWVILTSLRYCLDQGFQGGHAVTTGPISFTSAGNTYVADYSNWSRVNSIHYISRLRCVNY